jgi:hypothetical protein
MITPHRNQYKNKYEVRISVDGLHYYRSFDIEKYSGCLTAKVRAEKFAKNITEVRAHLKREYLEKLKNEMENWFDSELVE